MTKSYAAMPVSRISNDAQLPMEITAGADKPTAISLMKYFFETSLFIKYLYTTYSVTDFLLLLQWCHKLITN